MLGGLFYWVVRDGYTDNSYISAEAKRNERDSKTMGKDCGHDKGHRPGEPVLCSHGHCFKPCKSRMEQL